jgi:hypothetical protein
MKNLSFIFQGPYYQAITDECIKTVRNNFPDSAILFSTWAGQQVPAGLADKIIYSPDPGGKINSIWNTSDSTLRQLFSTYNALVDVTTEYCCKIRSDTCLENNKLTELIQYLNSNHLNRLVFLNYLSVNPQRFPLAFHFCDWLVAGRTDELKKVYHHKDQEATGMCDFFGVTVDRYQYGWYCRYRSEQYIILNWIKNLRSQIRIPANQTEISADIITSHDEFMRNHVLMIPGQSIGVRNMKRPHDLTLNASDALFCSNYYDWECGEGLAILGLSVWMTFVRCLFLSFKRMVLSPIHVMKFIRHVLRYKGAAGWWTGRA